MAPLLRCRPRPSQDQGLSYDIASPATFPTIKAGLDATGNLGCSLLVAHPVDRRCLLDQVGSLAAIAKTTKMAISGRRIRNPGCPDEFMRVSVYSGALIQSGVVEPDRNAWGVDDTHTECEDVFCVVGPAGTNTNPAIGPVD